jgi:hypothetical protein
MDHSDHSPSPEGTFTAAVPSRSELQDYNPQGCLGFLGWSASAFVLPVFSPTFYSRAVRSRLFTAMAFFFFFALALSVVQTLSLVNNLLQIRREMQDAYRNNEFPVIRIEGGEAQVEGPQPYVFIDDETTLVAVDTSGTYQDIDYDRYSQGLLLTRRALVYLTNTGEYQRIPLHQLQIALNMNPKEALVLDAQTVLSLWTLMGIFLTLTALFGLLLLNTFGRLVMLILLALILWGLTILVRKETSFADILAPGFYAIVPAVYFSTLLARIGLEFFGLFTVMAGVFWLVALLPALYPYRFNPAPSTLSEYFKSERPLRPWRAWIGLPLLILLAYETVFGWQAWYISWSTAFLTLIVLAAVSILPWRNMQKSAAAEAVTEL